MTTRNTGIYKRYFRVTTGPLIDAVKEIHKQQTAAVGQIRELINELGAKDAKLGAEGNIIGFTFDETPDSKLWKRTRRGWYYPKQSSNAGRDLIKRIKALPKHPSYDEAVLAIGLIPGFPALVDTYKGVGHSVTLSGHIDLGVWFVTVPWEDIDPGELEQYKRDKASGKRWSASLDHLCWEPTADLIEVKEWQVLKEIDEMNEKLRENKT